MSSFAPRKTAFRGAKGDNDRNWNQLLYLRPDFALRNGLRSLPPSLRATNCNAIHFATNESSPHPFLRTGFVGVLGNPGSPGQMILPGKHECSAPSPSWRILHASWAFIALIDSDDLRLHSCAALAVVRNSSGFLMMRCTRLRKKRIGPGFASNRSRNCRAVWTVMGEVTVWADTASLF